MTEKVSTTNPLEPNVAQLEWVKVKQELNAAYNETTIDKLNRKSQMNPFVPIGCVATVGCLVMGLYGFKKGNRALSQYMMRFRIGAQAFTVFAIMTGVMMSATQTSSED